MNKRTIKIAFFCMVFSGLLLLLCILGMKQLQAIGSMKNETESVAEDRAQTEAWETGQQETESESEDTESLAAEQSEEAVSEAEPTETELLAEESSKNTVSMESYYDIDDLFPYYIKVNRLANCVTVYGKDKQGEYTIPVKAMVCSVGRRGNTPLGVFKTSDKYDWRYLYGDVYGQYAYRITGSFLFHSVPYYEQDKSTLKTEEYNKLGEAASDGCVRLSVEDAKWLIDNCPKGTTVEIYDSEDPGPLGKPEAIKIDTNSPNKNWDPTDPDEANPWKSVEADGAEPVQTENWTKEYIKDTVNSEKQESEEQESEEQESEEQESEEDQTPPVIQIIQEELTIQIGRGDSSEDQLLEQAKASAIGVVSSNVIVEEDSFYTNVLHVESVEKEYQESSGVCDGKRLTRVKIKVKISVEDACQNRSEKSVMVLVEIQDAYG